MRIDPSTVTPTNVEPIRPRRTSTQPSSIVKVSSSIPRLAAVPGSPTTTTRLECIRTMLDAGEYPIDLDQLAARILDKDVLRNGGKP